MAEEKKKLSAKQIGWLKKIRAKAHELRVKAGKHMLPSESAHEMAKKHAFRGRQHNGGGPPSRKGPIGYEAARAWRSGHK